MAKTNEIIYSIVEQCTGKIPSDDIRLSIEFVLYKVNSVRALLIREDIVSGRNLDESYYQLKCCLDVECNSLSCEHNGVMLDSNQVSYYVEIPKLIEGIGWRNISFLGTINFGEYRKGVHSNFDRYNFGGFLSLEHQEWAGKRPAYTVIGGFKAGTLSIDGSVALLKNIPTDGLKKLCINGIFSNPENGICDVDDFMEIEYPLPEHHLHRLELIVIQQILSSEAVPGDIIQNSVDNTGNKVLRSDIARNMGNQAEYKENNGQ